MDNWKDMSNGKKGAFACETNAKWNLGLTKREYMATAMLQGLLSNSDKQTTEMKEVQLVEYSIYLTDELLKQLES